MYSFNKTATAGFGNFTPSSGLKQVGLANNSQLQQQNLGKIINYTKTEGIND